MKTQNIKPDAWDHNVTRRTHGMAATSRILPSYQEPRQIARARSFTQSDQGTLIGNYNDGDLAKFIYRSSQHGHGTRLASLGTPRDLSPIRSLT
ncbi:hypothetical protein BaRGS_00024416 [Batillaria attramentaria]|uniref:Uncharacterized protein n=1 Tax=Batillaria attramentaria TaxID=370345 RepID=A0ABD0KB05_9CAEN